MVAKRVFYKNQDYLNIAAFLNEKTVGNRKHEWTTTSINQIVFNEFITHVLWGMRVNLNTCIFEHAVSKYLTVQIRPKNLYKLSTPWTIK